MKVSTKGRYALRAMLDLALNQADKPVLLKDIARRQEISEPYLELLMVPLRKGGLVTSLRGAHGGYRLGRHPAQIRLSEIVEAVEGPFAPVDCVGDDKACPRSQDCAARDVWQEVGQAMYRVLDAITLEELGRRQREKESAAVPMYHI